MRMPPPAARETPPIPWISLQKPRIPLFGHTPLPSSGRGRAEAPPKTTCIFSRQHIGSQDRHLSSTKEITDGFPSENKSCPDGGYPLPGVPRRGPVAQNR